MPADITIVAMIAVTFIAGIVALIFTSLARGALMGRTRMVANLTISMLLFLLAGAGARVLHEIFGLNLHVFMPIEHYFGLVAFSITLSTALTFLLLGAEIEESRVSERLTEMFGREKE